MKVNNINLSNLTNNEFDNNEFVFIPDRVLAKYNAIDKQLEITSNSKTNPDTSIYPGGRSKDKIPFGLKAGKSYTFITELNVLKKIKGIVDSEGLKLSVIPIVDGKVLWNFSKSNKGFNINGRQYLVTKIEIPSNASGLWIRLNSGMLKNCGKVTWKNLIFIEGDMINEKLLTSNNYTNLIKINQNSLNINLEKAFEYAITILTATEIENLKLIDKEFYIDFKSVLEIKKFLSDLSNGKNKIDNAPLNLLKILKKYGIDKSWFLHIHTKNVTSRLRSLFWLINNLGMIKENAQEDIKSLQESTINKTVPVFVYWADGFNNAPEIIKSIKSILISQAKEFNVVLLNDNNINFYIDIPEDIKININKLHSKSIANASDYYRIALLKKYGGIWIDSTVVPGKNFDERILALMNRKNNVVTPRYEKNIASSTSISSWFMAVSNPANEIISTVEAALRIWLLTNDEYSYYFMFHAFWDFLIQLNDELKQIWNNSDYLSAYECHFIQKNMYNKMTPKLQESLQKNLVNKLTYKFDSQLNNADSVLSFIGRKLH